MYKLSTYAFITCTVLQGNIDYLIIILEEQYHVHGQTWENEVQTGSIPRCPLRYHSLVCFKNNLFIVGIGPIIKKELGFIFPSDRSVCTYVDSWVQNILYKDVKI